MSLFPGLTKLGINSEDAPTLCTQSKNSCGPTSLQDNVKHSTPRCTRHSIGAAHCRTNRMMSLKREYLE